MRNSAAKKWREKMARKKIAGRETPLSAQQRRKLSTGGEIA
jgi:hypothetical protein